MKDPARRCEERFTRTAKRLNDARFRVKLSFRQNVASLSVSKDIATKRFHRLVRKITKDSNLRDEYRKFISEYQELGYMAEINLDQLKIDSKPHRFFWYHYVLRPETTPAKTSAVFDASSETLSRYSLNDVLCIGPIIQPNRLTILIRFRFLRCNNRYMVKARLSKKLQTPRTAIRYPTKAVGRPDLRHRSISDRVCLVFFFYHMYCPYRLSVPDHPHPYGLGDPPTANY